jgi:hypothetical protein
MFILPHLKGLLSGNLGSAAFKSAGLDLKFAANKSLVDSIGGNSLVSFARAGSAANAATFVDSSGVLQRAVTNLLLRSEEFNNGSWSKINTTITADAATSPTGTLTADKLVENATTDGKLTAQSVTLIASTTYSASIYIKAAERPTLLFHVRESAYNIRFGGFFNTSTGVFTAESVGGGVLTGSSFTNIGNGWYRCTITGTLGAVTSAVVTGYLANNVNNIGYLGDGTSGLFIWGAQLEQSSTVGEYIPTTSTINSAPRFDHNPTTGESLGLLVEEARTNIATQSEALDASPWGVSNLTVTANSTDTLSPDGVTYPEKFLETSATSNHTFFRSTGLSITAGTVYTASVFIKRIGGQYYQIVFDDNITVNGGYVNVDLVNGTITASANYGTGANIASSITQFGNGWFRISITSTAGALATIARVAVNTLSSGSQTQFAGFAGNTSNGCYLWGVVAEAGAFPTSYIPTTTAIVTRAADVASITGSNFGSFYNQTEGTVFAEVTASPNTSTSYAAISNGTTSQNSTYFDNDTGIIRSVTFSASSAVSVLGLGAIGTVGTGNKLTSAYKANDFAAARNGGTAQTDTSGAVPVSVTQLDIGRNPNAASAAYLSGTIKRLTYWPTRLANTTLQQITQP